ncbi:MAG: hypothetical protein ACXW4E_03215 [Anaerolineales bacterium]
MRDAKREGLDWVLWFYWIMATTTGWVLGLLLVSGLPLVASGVAIAGMQWAVLYRRIPRAWRWAILSSIAWIAAYIIFILFIPARLDVVVGPLMGGILGLAQWYLLKEEFDWAGWWIVISILAWTTGLVLMPGLLTSGSLPGALTGLTLVILLRYASRRTTGK